MKNLYLRKKLFFYNSFNENFVKKKKVLNINFILKN